MERKGVSRPCWGFSEGSQGEGKKRGAAEGVNTAFCGRLVQKLTAKNYLPPAADSWLRCQPASIGLNAGRLHHAVEFAVQHESDWLYDLSEQKAIAGSEPPPWNVILGPLKPRG